MRLILLSVTCFHLLATLAALQSSHRAQVNLTELHQHTKTNSSTIPILSNSNAGNVSAPVGSASSQAQEAAQAQAEAPRRQASGPVDDEYLVGVGIADITGPSADINLVSLLRRIATTSADSSPSAGPTGLVGSGSTGASRGSALVQIQHPSWRELRDIKLQLKINLNSLLSAQTLSLFRWAMPNQVKIQAEYTYANLVVQF